MINKSFLFNVKKRERHSLKFSCFSSKVPWIAPFLILMLLAGCAANQSGRLPAVSYDMRNRESVGKFVWLDLMTEDVQAASDFYRSLFGWQSEISEENKGYHVLYKGGRSIGGMVAIEDENKQAPESIWIVSLSVDDVDRAASLVSGSGGKVLDGPTNADGRGRMAMVSDPSGAVFILLRSSFGDPADKKAGIGEWLWTDLFTQNGKKAEAFYTSLAGYQVAHIEDGKDHKYNILKRDGHPRAGIVELRSKGLKDNWLPYFRVDDVDRTIEKAGKLGGKLILQTEDAAILSDPTGAAFGIQTTR